MSDLNRTQFNVLFDLPYSLILTFLESWLDVRGLCRIDSALSGKSAAEFSKRTLFLKCLRNPNTLYNGLNGCGRVDIFHYTKWLQLRQIKVKHNLNIKSGYKFLCKRLPSLCDVVGSVDSGTSRGNITEKAVGGVFNYTPDSIDNILAAMNLPDGGLRFLDAGCGNAIFLTLVRMSFPSAQLLGIDLQPVINTLQSIQKYCNYEPFKNLPLVGMDVTTPAFASCLHDFQPTHTACIIGLEDEENAFLRAVQATPSVVGIAVAEKRNPVQDTDFMTFGFEQTHRVAVYLAGSRKKRYVLIAQRIKDCQKEVTDSIPVGG